MFEKETRLFEKKLPSFLESHENQFVVIKGEKTDFFPTEDSAIEYGLRQYGATSSFLVREITQEKHKVEIPALSYGLL